MSRPVSAHSSVVPSWRRRTVLLVVLSLLLGFVGTTGVTTARVPEAAAAVSATQVSNWKLDAGSGTTAIDSVGTEPATLGSGATWTPGIRGASSLAFNGSATATATTTGSVLNTASSFSVTSYVKLNSISGGQTLVSQDGNSASGFYLQLRSEGKFGFTRLGVDGTTGSNVYAAADVAPVVGQWYHLAGVYNSANNTLSLYVNGRLQQTVTAPTAWSATGNLVMGRGKYNGAAIFPLNGTLDDVRAYSGALTADDVEQIADSAWYKLDEGSGTTAIDSGLTQVNGSLLNGATWGPGARGTAVVLDGTNDFLDSSRSRSFDSSKSFSVALWARTTQLTSARTVASSDASNASAFSMSITATGKWAFTRASSDVVSPTLTSATSTGSATINTWDHLVGVYDSVADTLRLFVNGVQQGAPVSYTTGWKGAGNFIVGRGIVSGALGSYFSGGADDVHLYPFVVDDAMAAQLADLTPPAIPPPTPATPTATSPSSSSVTLNWVAPTPVSGYPTTGYVVTPYVNGVAQAPQTFSSTPTSHTFTGLTSGASYRYTVAAVNVNGTSSPSAQSAAVVPTAVVPAAPTGVSATAGSLSATVTWTAPANNGTAITSFVITPYVGATAGTAQTFNSTATTQTVTGLTAGTAYTFKVSAVNAVGTGPQSAASTAVTPNASPGIVVAAPPSGQAGVAYSFTFTRSGGTPPVSWSVSAGSLPSGLSLGAGTGVLNGSPTTAGSYSFTVKLTDDSGATDTEAVTLLVTDKPATPAAPTASAGLTSAVVSWVAPAGNGSPITAYVITPYKGGLAQTPITVDPSAKTRTLNGLTAGSIYSFAIAATNALGTSAASGVSNSVTPYAALNEPTITAVTAGSTSARLSWNAPSSVGGSAVTGYVVTPYIGATAQTPRTFTGSATTQTVTGLTPGTAYTFKVAATNLSGGNVLYRVNAAGPAVAAIDGGPVWAADDTDPNPLRNNGSAAAGSPAGQVSADYTVPGTTPNAIFDTERYGQMAWAFPVASGAPVKVRMYFANHYGGTSTVGSRVFDISLDNTVVLPSFDPIAAAGADLTGTMREFALTSDGTVNIDTTQILQNPLIYGIEIIQTGTAATGPPSASSSAVTPNASPTLTFAAPPPAPVGVAYSQQLPVNGGTAPFVWSVSAGTLPAGITLSSGGLLSGTPTTVGSSTFTVQVLDASGQTATRSVTLVVNDRPATPVAPTATAGITSATVTWVAPAANGSPLTGYVVTPYKAGVAQAPVSFDASATTRTVTGLTAASAYSFTVAAVNAVGTSAASPSSNTVVPYAVPAAPVITAATAADSAANLTWTAPAANGSAITGYVVTPFIGGTAQATQSFGGSTTTALITGLTPGTSYTFVVAAQNAAGTGAASAPSAAVVPNASPTLTFPAPPPGQVGVAYSQLLTVTGGTAPFTWSVATGTLPAGISLSPAGRLSGTPTAAGTYAFSVQVSDASGQTATKAISLVIGASPTVTFTPAAGEVGVAYSQQPTVSGGTSPYTWVVTAGSLPAGLTINASTGLISGTPTAAGSPSATVTVTDGLGQSGSKTATIVIAAAPTLTSTPPAGQSGEPYSYTFVATGGTGPFTYAVVAGSLPSGFALSSTGVLSGSTAIVANTSFTVRVTDSFAQTATRAVTLVIGPAPVSVVKTADATTTTPGSVVRYTITVANSSTTRTYNGAQITDPLGDITDDAVYNNDATVTVGTVTKNASSLQWDITIAPSSSTTLTYTVTVANPGTGNKVLTGTMSTSFPSTNCNPGTQTSACTSSVNISALTIVKSADVSSTTPGSTVSYTIAVTNTGTTAYTGATLSDSLAAVLDDATYNGDATATRGSVSYASSTLTWTGNLAVGASASITYTATVKNPDPGNKILTGTVVSPTSGSTCPSANPAASCTATVTVLVPALVITNTASSSTTTPGSVVPYTVTLSNTGQTGYTGTSVTIGLAGAADDAVYNNDAATTAGTVVFNETAGTFVWTGNLAVGAVVTITASATVRDPDTGNKVLTTVASSAAPGSTCPAGSGNPDCTSTVLVLMPALTITKSSDVSSTTPGSTVAYTVLVTNSGQTPYAGATFTDSLTGVLDDAGYNNNASASLGTVSYGAPNLTWTGNLAVGASATITYTVTVDNPGNGDKSLVSTIVSTTQGNNCVTGGSDPRCTSTVAVLVPGLSIITGINGSSTTPGSVVRFTTNVTNTGQTTYTGFTITSDITGVSDDATSNRDVTVSTGSVTPVSANLASWTLTLAPGQSASITGSFTVNSPASGDRSIVLVVSSDAPGSSCPTGSSNAGCTATVPVLIPGLTITKTANSPSVVTGGTVDYTIVVANTGETTYSGASFTDSLSDVLADATYAGGATATTGTVTYAAPTLAWSGSLAPGATSTITYSVVARDPDPGDKLMINTVVSTSAGANCAAGSSDSRCTAVVGVLVPGLTIVKTASSTTTVPGAIVTYTVKVTNSGTTAYPAANFADWLDGVLDDAVYNNDVAATAGSASVTTDILGWSGSLAVGASATITYSVTVKAAAGGDNVLTNSVTSSSRGNNCPVAGTDPRCVVTVPVARLELVRSPAETTTTPGSVVHLPVTFTNTGKVAYTGISVVIPRLDTADDVFSTGPEVPSSGSLTSTADATVWTGDIPVGGVVTIAFTRTVKDPDTGNKLIAATMTSTAAGNNCPSGGTDPRCSMAIPVLVPGLTISKVADKTAVEPGGSIGYTVTVRNSGQTPYGSAVVTDAMAGALDNAGYSGDAVASSGSVSYAAPNLSWTGALAVGATATITYSMTANDPGTGDKDVRNTISSTDVGSTCVPGGSSAACSSSVAVLTPAVTLTKTADLTSATLGSAVTYTVLVDNTGQTTYPAATFDDSLAGVLDDATYNPGSTTATTGTVTYAGEVLSWSGALAPGARATITYTVTLKTPAAGDRSLTNTVVSAAAGSNCGSGSTDNRCTAVVAVTNAQALTFTKTASPATTVAGGVVAYTVKVANATQAAITGVSFTDALAGVLDDATYNGDATASTGTVSLTSPDLTWTGTVPAQGVVTVTYSVTTTGTGNQLLTSRVSSTSLSASNNCTTGSTDLRCASTVPVARLRISTGDYASTTTPGSALPLGLTYTNTGQVPYTNISISTDATDLLDDVDLTGNQTASSGELTIGGIGATWVGDIPVGATITLSSTFTVKSPATGNRSIFAVTFTDAPGSNCGRGSLDTACTATTAVLVPALSIAETASTSATVAGGVVGHTITVSNTGETPYSGAVVSDNLAGTLDDAVYNADATATRGSVAYTNPTLTWTGDLAVGESATITYTTTVNDPTTGDKTMVNRVSSTEVGSSCPPASGNSACRTTVVVLTPALTITKTADQANATLGSTVTYTVLVRNTGQTSYSAAAFNDSLADVLDESTYDTGSATATSGTVSYASPVLSWSGALAPGASATITYSVSITNPATGDGAMTNVVISNNVGSNCSSGSVDSRCRVLVSVTNALSLTFTKTSDVKAAAVGGQVHYTVQVVNSSSSVIAGVNLSDPLAAILDDATYGNDAVATSGTVSYAAPNLSWTGDVPAAGTVTITYSVTVTGSGDKILTGAVTSTSLPASNNCLAASTDPRCTNRVTVAQLLIQQSYTELTTTPGSLIHLSATFTNTGQTNYEGITISSPNAGTLDDAAPTGDQSATSGTLVLSAAAITWTGDIAVGSTVTVTGTLAVHDPDLGDKTITGTLASSALGNNCPPGGSDPRCTATSTVLIPGLTVTKSADTGAVAPGGTVSYTVTVYNSGQAPYPAASITDSLTGVLDDATYNGDAQASLGSVSYADSTLSWTGGLAVGQTSVITYSVDARSENVGGDRTMVNTAVSNNPGSNCATASGDPACRAIVVVLYQALTITKSVDLATATLGSTVTYTVTVANSGQVAYPNAEFSDDLAGVLDDAGFADPATATRGTVGLTGATVSWSGGLAPGESAVITYAVRVNNPASGDLTMDDTAVSNTPGSNCQAASTDERCSTEVTVVDATSLTFTKTADTATAVAGQQVTYTVRVLNSTTSTISGVDFTDALAETLDDAVYNGDAVASAGTATYTAPDLTWVGAVPAGESVTVTYSVTVQSPPTGDLLLTAALTSTSVPDSNNCAAGSVDPLCDTTVAVAQLELRQFAAETTATPGSVVHLTQTYTNTGQVPYVGITVSSPRADTSDDTVPTGDQVASSGTIVRTATEVAWTGDIAVGGTVTITRTLIVKNPDPGNQIIRATLRSDAAGNNCASGTTDPLCSFSITVLTPGLTITKTANKTTVVPNGNVAYTITVTNTGQTPYTGATVTDTLTGVLDDATYNANATATTGFVAFSSPLLTWTGDLAVGATATLTFTVSAHIPADGDKLMVNRLSSTEVGSTCPPASSNPACVNTVDVRTPALTTVLTASQATAKPGDVVTYTTTTTNTGQTDYASATVSVPLAGLLDDATYDDNVTASTGSVVRNGQSLDWAGPLVMGDSVTITYAVTVDNPVSGNHRLEQTLINTRQGSNCLAGSVDPRCTSSVPIASLLLAGSANISVAKPTDVVRYTNTFTNTGQVPYVGISVTTDVLGAADDANYNGDAVATFGSVAITPGARIVWTGDIPVGATVTFTASITVKNPDPGNQLISSVLISDAPGSNCPTGSSNPVCASVIPVLTPGLDITKTADRATTTPGGTVDYTITVHNTGQYAYTGATVTDLLVGATGSAADAAYAGTPAATTGSVIFTDPGLRWTGDLAIGQTAVITYSVLVSDPDPGDKLIDNVVVSDELGSTCPTGSSNPSCRVQVLVLVPALNIAVSADQTTTTPGSTVGYTVTVQNTGQTPYAGASVTAALAGVLDDATYAGDATSTSGGTFTFAEGALNWTGDLAVGATTTLSYTVTVASPDTGNRQLTTSVTSPSAGSTCRTTTDCVNTVEVRIPGLAVSTTSDVATATPGDRVNYTITLVNTGQTPYVGTTATSVLTGVLDDSTLNGSIQASSGVASYTAPTLTWTGDLAVGATVQITYSVTVRTPDPANKRLTNTVVVNAPGSTCPAGGSNPTCSNTVTVLVPALTITKLVSSPTTTPGGRLTYTINLTNAGETAYSGASAVDSLSSVLSDATYDGDAAVVGGGQLTYTDPNLTWTGDLPIGASATITYSVTIKNPDPGDKHLTNGVVSSAPGSSCPPGNSVPACTTAVTVLVPALSVNKTVDRATVTAGGAVGYTITVTNTGETDYPLANVTDVLSGVLDDADYAGDATATLGALSYADETLAWSGPLAMGETAVISYSVTTRFPAAGDRTMTNAVTSTSAGSSCTAAGEDDCSTTVAVLIPALTLSKTADRSEVVGRGTVTYTILATNTGAADYPSANLSDSLADVLDDAAYNGDATTDRGTVTYAGGTLAWNGPLAQDDTVTISYSVTVDTSPTGDNVLRNGVVSTSVGGTCAAGNANAACTTTTTVSAGYIGLSDLTPAFTLTGAPGATVTSDGAVGMTVDTNSLGGYNVTVQGTSSALQPQTPGNPDVVPLSQLRVREAGDASFTPLSAQNPFIVHRQTGPSGAGGDRISNDYQVSVPFAVSDTYSTTLEYIATAE